MPDVLTKAQRSKCMSRIRSKNTRIEVMLCNALFHAGIRYRKNYKKIPGTPDIAITKHKIAVFCDSEFFHGRDWPRLRRKLLKSNNAMFWINKIKTNRAHDRRVNKKLAGLGWDVLRFWGSEITADTSLCVKIIMKHIDTKL